MGTNRRRLRVHFGVGVLATCLLSGFVRPAFAQDQPPPDPQGKPRTGRPFRGVFGGGSPDPTRGQSLEFNLSTSADYIDNVTPFQEDTGIGTTPVSGAGGVRGNAGLSYGHRWNHVSLQASSSHNGFYYPDFGDLAGVGHSVSLGFSAVAGQRFSVRAGQSVGYSPFYEMGGLFGADPTANAFISNPVYGVSQRHTLQLFTNAATSYELTRRTTLDANYTRQQVRFTHDDVAFGSQSAGARLGYRLTRNASVHAGYSRSWGDYGTLYVGGLPVTQHNIDVGVDYNRSLSRTRQSTFGFSTGAVTYTTSSRAYYRFLANAHIDTEIGRSWSARADYARDLNWLQGLSEPVFLDMVTLGATGYLGTRVQVSFTAAYSNGQPGLTGGTASVDTYTGRGRLRLALNHFVALSTQYLYYHYTFSPDYPLAPGIPHRLDRQTMLVGIDLWVPLLR